MTDLFRRNVLVGLLLCSLAALICFGILGVGRSGESSFDFAVMYAGGREWLEGGNPYNQNELNQIIAKLKGGFPQSNFDDAPFSYPPQSAAFFVTLALSGFSYAKIVWLVLNLLSVAAIVAMTIYTINRHAQKREDLVVSGVMAAFIIGNPLTTNVVWEGQTSLIVFAATMAAWIFGQQQKWLLAGICLAIASIKPQMSLLVVIWFLLERNWKILAVALGTAVVMSIDPMLVQGPVGMLVAWHERIQSHQSFYANVPGSEFVIGLQSLLTAAGLTVPSLDLLGVVSVIILWVFRKRIYTEDIFGILMALTLTFIFNMDTAFVALIPIITSFWLYSYNYRKALPVLILLVFLFVFPRRLVRELGVPVLNQWRTVVVIIMLTIVVWFSIKHKSNIHNSIEAY